MILKLIVLITLIYFLGLYDGVLVIIAMVILKKYYKYNINEKRKKRKLEEVQEEFHLYLKRVILLTYTRPLKVAFKSVKVENEDLKKIIEKFNNDIKYDFTLAPYKNLALSVNDNVEKINYELNIMYLLYEYEKKGLGKNFISDIITEIEQLNQNKIKEKIHKLKESGHLYSLPPTVINFIYLTLILFNVIDKIIMSAL